MESRIIFLVRKVRIFCFLFHFFQDFSVGLCFSAKCYMPNYKIFRIYPVFFLAIVYFGKFSGITASYISSLHFSLFSVFWVYMFLLEHLLELSHSSWVSIPSFSFIFLFAFQFLKFPGHRYFSWLYPFGWWGHQKHP